MDTKWFEVLLSLEEDLNTKTCPPYNLGVNHLSETTTRSDEDMIRGGLEGFLDDCVTAIHLIHSSTMHDTPSVRKAVKLFDRKVRSVQLPGNDE